MIEQIIRDCVVYERLERSLSDYHSRRMRGVSCPDPLPPEERASIDCRHDQRLQGARMFVSTLRTEMRPAQ